MTPADVSELESIQIEMDCIGCKGQGEVTKSETRIAKRAIERHLEKHAYKVPEGGNQLRDLPIGADCDCPRETVKVTRVCTGCNGKKRRMHTFRIPKAGKKIEVLNSDLLASIFGEEELPEEQPVVHKVEHDEFGMYGFPADIVVHASWDRLLKNGAIPKGKTAELWAFALNEIRTVTK